MINSKVLLFLITYVLAGRKIGIPLGFVLRLDPVLILFLGLSIDLCQIALFTWFYEQVSKLINRFSLERILNKLSRYGASRLINRSVFAEKYKLLGLMVLAALPIQGGGIWSACLLARYFSRRKGVYLSIFMGSLLGCLSLILICLGILEILHL